MRRPPPAGAGSREGDGSVADLLVDTDVLIDHLRGARRLQTPGGGSLSYSVITRCELLAGPERQEEAARRLLASLRELPLDGPTADAAGLIRRRSGIATPDALIAATAIRRGHDLLTRNRRYLERVEGLRLAPG